MSRPFNARHDTSLGSVCALRGETVDPARCPDLPYVGLEHLDPGSPLLPRWGTASDVSSTKARFHEGDVLFGKLRPNLRKSALAPFEGVCSTDILVFRVNPGVDAAYLSFLAHSTAFREHAIRSIGGVNLPRTSWAALREFRFVLPPLPEQRAIAAALRAVQDARDARRRELALERERKAALMEDLFTKGTRGEPCKATEIGPMPRSWMIESLGSFVAGTPQNGLYKHADLYGEGTPIIRITDFNNDGLFVVRDFNRVRLAAAEVERYKVFPGDILINRVNSLSHLGKCCLVPDWPEATVFESNMMRFRLNVARLTPEFLQRFLMTEHCRRIIRGKAKLAVAQASINQSDVQGLQVPVPTPGEQRDIAEVLTACDRKIAALEREAAVQDELFHALLEELMTGRLSALPLAADAGTSPEGNP